MIYSILLYIDMVLMPGEGYEGVTKFVLDVMTSYGLNAYIRFACY